MRQNASTITREARADREATADQPRDGLDASVEVSFGDLLDRVWRFFTAKRTGLVLILAMGALSLAGTLLAQAPDGVRADPQAYASWLDSVRPKYGGWTGLLDKAGLFDIFSSVWFKGVSVLLAVSILACSAHRAPLLWKRAMHPRTHVSDSFFAHAALREDVTLPVSRSEALERARSVLAAHHFRVIADPKDPGRALYADRNRFGPFGTLAAHVSFVLILIGVVLSAATGFKNTDFTATVGSRVDVGNGTGLAVEAKSFTDSYFPDGSPKDYASDLVLYQNGRKVAAQTVRVNHPLRWGGVSFYQSFFGTSAAMRVTDGGGRTLFDSGVPLTWQSDDGKHSIGRFTPSGQKLVVYVVGTASGEVDPRIAAGQMQLEIYKDGQDQPVATQVVSQGKPASVAGLTFTFVREARFTGLTVSRDPGAVWVWVGSALMVLGLFSVFFFPHRRIWVHVRPASGTGEAGREAGSEVRFAAPLRRDLGSELKFRQLAADLALTGEPGERQQKK